jgi:hypothetical protein
MIVEPGAKVTLDDLSNSGTLLLKSDATSISSLILGSYSGNDADVELYLTGGPAPVEGNRWHLISSPFMTLSRDPIWAVTNNLAQWVESYDRGDLDEGWIAADGWDYALGSIPGSPTTFTNLNLGQGYTHFYSSNYTYTISGELNTENKSVNIYCTDTDQPLLYGHNLLGNPFSSGLDWDQIVDDGAYPASTSKVLHYRKDGGHVYYINDIGSEPGVNGIIPPMQGFFVKTYAASGSINLAASARVHDNIPTRYKGGEKAFIPLVRLKINTGERYDYAVVRFDELAKTGLDYDFDAVKDFISTTKPTIYTISGGTKFVINGLPFPEESVDIPVAVKLITAGNQTINTTELTGLDSYNLYLIDNETGYMANLRTNPLVTFSSAPGLFTDRFILRISEITTDVENPLDFKTGAFNIYTGFGSLNIQTITDDWDGRQGSVRVLDLSGRTVTSNANVEFSRNSVIQVGAPTVKGLYVVEISSGAKRYVSKVVVSGNR